LRRLYLLQGLVEYDSRLRELGSLEIHRVSRAKLDELVPGLHHQGVVFELAPLAEVPLGELLDREPELLLILDEVVDPQNFGSLLRVAEAAGAGGVITTERRSAPLSGAARKASAGASELVTVVRVTNLQRTFDELKQRGYWTVGTAGEAAESLVKFEFPKRCAIVLGSEGEGMRELTRRQCDFLVSLPLYGKLDSLNVAQAAAVFLFEYRRQVSA